MQKQAVEHWREAVNRGGVECWSSPSTMLRVAELLSELDWSRSKVVDVGAGRGAMSRLLGEQLRSERGLDPSEHLFACDLHPDSFGYDGIECQPTEPDGRLPYEDAQFDAAISIEVIEHVQDQFAFMRELARVTKPGGEVIVTTPNVLNANSRVRTLLSGFPVLYDPLPLQSQDIRRLSGHIHPISPYYLAFNAIQAGLEDPRFHVDRTKRSAVALGVLLMPFLLLARIRQRADLARKTPEVLRENERLLAQLNGWGLLTSRTAVLRAVKARS